MDNIKSIIQKIKNVKGLFLYCPECNTTVIEHCKKTGKPLTQCIHKDKLRFKSIVSVPGTENDRRTKLHDAKNPDEGIFQHLEFKKEVKSGDHQRQDNGNFKENKITEQDEWRPVLLVHALARYVGWLSNEGVPAHLVKIRTQDHIKDVERALKCLVACLKESGYNLSTLTIDEINNNLVGKVFLYLERRKFSSRTFNKYLSFYTSFLTWYDEEYDYSVRNYFARVVRKKLNPKPEAITLEEYEALLAIITPENGVIEYNNRIKPLRNIFRPWLADGFRLALETGRRREELINLKWNSIKKVNGTPIYIVVEDYKVNRIQNRIKEEEKKFIYIPITESLARLLKDLGQDKYEDTDKFILAPEVAISRKRVMADVLSRGFSHYYNQLNNGRKLTFKSLRKTYITNLELFMGRGNTKLITGHSDDHVIESSYLDKKEIAKAALKYKVFPEKDERSHDLSEIRREKEKKPKFKEREV